MLRSFFPARSKPSTLCGACAADGKANDVNVF
jgi:hypothetical protein